MRCSTSTWSGSQLEPFYSEIGQRHCTTGLERRISRDVHQDARDYAQALMQTEAYRVSRVARKKIETLFGEAKHIHSLVRLRLRGLSGARDEFLLTATVQKISQMPGRARHEAAATAHDSLTNAEKPNTTPSIDHQTPQPLGSGGKTLFDRPERQDPGSPARPKFLNGLS